MKAKKCECPKCGLKWETWPTLVRAYAGPHAGKMLEWVTCPRCGKQFARTAK